VGGIKKTTPRQVLRELWVDFKFGVLHVHTNYLDLLWYIYLRVVVVTSTLVLTQGLAYSISPLVGKWAVRSTLRTLFALANFEMVLVLPWIVFLAVVLRAMLSLPTRLALLLMMIPNKQTNGLALRGTTAVAQLKSRIHQMLRDTEEKLSENATLMPMLVGLSQRTVLKSIILIVVIAPIVEELKYRYLFNYMKGKLAQIIRFPDRDASTLKASTALGSFIFACAHISNWVSPNMNAAMVVDTNINAAILVCFAATVQFISSFFISQRVLFPVYEERGLAASIGAHVSWNALILTRNVHLPVRLWARAWKRLRRRKGAS
jgi:membrane protease YdiL (CAAX protease family)